MYILGMQRAWAPAAMKQRILGSPLGTLALRARGVVDRLKVPAEMLGTVANDQITEVLVTRICAPGKTFLDVGAHIGSITAEVLRHSPTVKVQAFEAIPDKVERLRRKFPQVKVHECALADSQGMATFYIDARHSAYSSLSRNSDDVQEIKVRLQTLDGLVDADDVDVLKIDVEGAELGVLRGSVRTLELCRPLVMFESGPQELLGFTKIGMWEFLNARSYGIFVPNRLAHTASAMSCEGFLESHLHPRRTTNYFAVPAERTAEIRTRARDILGIA
jgi:FkbM family methyltransferase